MGSLSPLRVEVPGALCVLYVGFLPAYLPRVSSCTDLLKSCAFYAGLLAPCARRFSDVQPG